MTRTGDSTCGDLETCVAFGVDESQYPPLESENAIRPFRDPAGLAILKRIAAGLSRNGYAVSNAKPAFGIEAGFSCQLRPGFDLQVSLGVSERRNGLVECDLITYHSPPFLKRILARDSTFHAEWVEDWRRFCLAVNNQLLQELGAVSVSWLTEQAASLRWKSQESGESGIR